MLTNEHISVDNKSCEKVKTFKYLDSLLEKQNSIHEEIKSRLALRQEIHINIQSKHSCLSPTVIILLNLKIYIYTIVILPVVLYGFQTFSLTLREERRLRMF